MFGPNNLSHMVGCDDFVFHAGMSHESKSSSDTFCTAWVVQSKIDTNTTYRREHRFPTSGGFPSTCLASWLNMFQPLNILTGNCLGGKPPMVGLIPQKNHPNPWG